MLIAVDQPLSDALGRIIAAQLDAENQGSQFTFDMMISLAEQPSVPKTLIPAITACLNNREVSLYALETLEKQPSLPEATIAAIVARLDDKVITIRQSAIRPLMRQPSISDGAKIVIAMQLEDEHLFVRETAINASARHGMVEFALSNSKHAECLYEMFLKASFERHLTWLVEDDGSMNVPVGPGGILTSGLDGRLLVAVHSAQQRFKVPSSKLFR